MMTDEDMARLHQLGSYMRAEFARRMPSIHRAFNDLHSVLFPEQHKRMMLCEARRRARLSTQRRRHS